MLAGSQIEILRDTEKYLTERVVECTRAVHPSESRASRRPERAIAEVAKHVVFRGEVGLMKASFAYAETVILTWNTCHIGMIAGRNSAGRW